MCGSPRARRVRIEDDQRSHVWPAIADDCHLADQRVALEQVLQVGRRDVLATGGDNQLFLAVDNTDVAVRVDGRHVACVQPAIGIYGRDGALRVLVVAAHDVAATHEQLSVRRQLQLQARVGLADRAESLLAQWIDGRADR